MWVLYSYNKYSESANKLAEELDIPITNKVLPNLKIINWGSSEHFLGNYTVLNSPENVRKAVDKIITFYNLNNKSIPTVEFTTLRSVAVDWISKGSKVYCRDKVASSGGDGIILAEDSNQLPAQCKLYTKCVDSPKEFRVHVMNGKVIDVTQKKRRHDSESSDWIRNYDNGWVYTRQDITVPKSVKIWSTLAVTKLGLDFGAVDILYKDGICYVLEVNTAPGLEGTTLMSYTKGLKELMKGGV